MKLRHLKTTTLATLATLVLSTASQAVISYNSGDVFLGIRQSTNTTSDFVVDLGPGSALRDFTTAHVYTLTNLNSTLSTLFGANWATDPTVTFGLIGTTQNTANLGDPIRLLYVSEPIGNPAPVNTSNQSAQANNVIGFRNYYQGLTESAVSNATVGSPGDTNSFTTLVQTGFASNNLVPIENTVAGGLEVYRVPQTTAGAVSDEGTLTYTGGNTFTFTPTPVPEPSAALLGGLAILGLASRRLRRSPRA
jgi:hypothetical protein